MIRDDDPILEIDPGVPVDETLADAGLPPAVGVKSYCVFRASRDAPDLSDGYGWTYHHHVDMACWRGRLYVGWNSCQRDEDIWPSRELFSTSSDGIDWSPPAELFPQGLSTCLRMYFYRAPIGRLLVIAGRRSGTMKTDEDAKGDLIVREIGADHRLGEIFTLQGRPKPDAPPPFERSGDTGLVESCRALLADTTFLEQQDRGRLLGDRRMKWHDAAAWPGGVVPGDNAKWVAGKAFSFFRRKDGAIVGVSKMGWTTISVDGGRTWAQPRVPPTLVTGKAKVWSQPTCDGRFALVYNPSRRNRYPLVIVTGDDGVRFGDMRLIQGELPIQRYAGADRSIGPQYVRGISHWADDGTRSQDRALWLVYSMSKEDIWVSRVPLPVVAEASTDAVSDARLDSWNLHVPKWSAARAIAGGVELENRDSFDHPIATRVFPTAARIELTFELRPGGGPVQVDLLSRLGCRRPVRLVFSDDTLIVQGAPPIPLGGDSWHAFRIVSNAAEQRFGLSVDGGDPIGLPFSEPADDIQRITLRLGLFRAIGGKQPVAVGSDIPTSARSGALRNLTWRIV